MIYTQAFSLTIISVFALTATAADPLIITFDKVETGKAMH